MTASVLFSPLKLRDLTLKNRIFVSPMCQYSCADGVPTDWHLVHLGSRAVGGAGLVMCEASGVSPEGRISPQDAGIWNQAQADAWAPITRFIKAQGAAPAMQLAHAGRKASTFAPWRGQGAVPEGCGGWPVMGPSAVAFSEKYHHPREMSRADIAACVEDFVFATELSLQAGFEVVEVHAAHGYLLHEFLSPLANIRTDEYGGSLENRMRFPLEVCAAVRKAWPGHLPVFVRISATDWKAGGWDVAQSVEFAKRAKALGIDLIDVSSGGNVIDQEIVLGPGYQVPFSSAIREGANIRTSAVGLITDAVQAEQVVAHGHADSVSLARALLRDPYWPLHAAARLGVEVAWPDQYKRAGVGPLGR
ncbi:MAG: NADH:flavin oxidoreductase/NADH oxidase [Betaproteobacteria bacterium]|nr:NADH:flavin oxidoreductase/NADH oxidase [Betaproteobacteria bacterium]